MSIDASPFAIIRRLPISRTAESWDLAPRATASLSGLRARLPGSRADGVVDPMAAIDPARRRTAVSARHGDSMEVRELKTLLVLMRDYGLVELEMEDKKGKVRLVRGGGRASVDVTEAGSDAHLAARAASPIKMATRHVEATAEEGANVAGKIDLAPNQKL